MKEEKPNFKYGEDESIKELFEYIKSTYSQHYANGVQNFQAFDGIMEIDGDQAWRFFRGCAFKYVWRFGRKNGFNRIDLMKALHYLVLLMFLTKDKK